MIEQILSNGNEGAANGRIKMEKGRGYAFSVFKGNKGAQIKTMNAYCIEI
ncbi:hypothetical protein [Cyclobacterium sp. 1_MG-2023]|nr:hypothetical protein [Cyclobacterium sp. 1_MG-2023]